MFSFSSGAQISGGNFYEIAGDMHLSSAPPPEPRTARSFRATHRVNHLLCGPQRHGRSARISPYDISRRPQISDPHSSYHLEDRPWSRINEQTSISAPPLSPSSPDPLLYPFSPPEVEFHQDGYAFDSQYLPMELHDSYSPPTGNNPIIEYPTHFDPILGPESDHHGFGVEQLGSLQTSAMSYRSRYISGGSSQRLPPDNEGGPLPDPLVPYLAASHYPPSRPNFQFLGRFDSSNMIGDASGSQYPSVGRYPESTNPPAFPGDEGGPPVGSNVAPINQWYFPGQESQQKPQTIINDGTFMIAAGNVIQSDLGLHILHRAAANDAAHDAGDRYPQPRCHPETRAEILADLDDWSSEDDPRRRMVWLYGPAGAGKSAVMQSFCQQLATEHLGGSFFFKRGHPSRGHAMKLFPTIAYHLAVVLPEFKSAVVKRIEKDPSIFDKSLSIQLQQLIIEPFRDIASTRTLVIAIDGLDECEGDDHQQQILWLIGNAVLQSQLPLRFLVASRPEPHIGQVFREPFLDGFHWALNIEKSFDDVRTYLRDEFTRIRREHHETMVAVASPWPSREVVEYLVEKSSGYFIYPATVIKFIDDKRFRPTEGLEIIMGIAEPEFESPFSALDQLYRQILAAVPPRPQLLRIFSVLVVEISLSMSQIEQLLELKPGDVRLTLRGLHSVIKIPQLSSGSESDDDESDDDESDDDESGDDESGDDLTVHHASFLDFLNDPTRSRTFHVGDVQRHGLACDFLKAFSYTNDDPSVNAIRGYVAWRLNPATITFPEPSVDWIPLLHRLNPDFLFGGAHDWFDVEQMVHTILDWLKKVQPSPEDLIRLWDDYSFMLLCDKAWQGGTEDEDAKEFQNIHGVVSQASSQPVQVLYGYTILSSPSHQGGLFDIRVVLNYSWVELRAAICPLRGITGEDALKLAQLVPHPIRIRELRPQPTLRNFAKGLLQLKKKIGDQELPREFERGDFSWSFLLRACPPCADLLHSLYETECVSINDPGWYDNPESLHNVIEWLKTFPQPPLDFITRFQCYLWCKEHTEEEGHNEPCIDDGRLEQRWEQWKQRAWWL